MLPPRFVLPFTSKPLRTMLGCALFVLAGAASAATEVNTASQAELESVQGLGVTRVEQILAEREHHGLFADANDLANRVPGLGRKSVRQLMRNGLSINGQTLSDNATPN